MSNIIIFLIIIIYSIIMLYIGFKLALLRWNYKENLTKLENYEFLNKELTNANRQHLETIRQDNEVIEKNKAWYINQLKTLSVYLKDHYNDKFIENQLYTIIGDPSIAVQTEQKNYDLDKILDKINENGIESLSIDELNFLKNNSKNL